MVDLAMWKRIQDVSKGNYGLSPLQFNQTIDGEDFVSLLNKTAIRTSSLYGTAPTYSRMNLPAAAHPGLYGDNVQPTPQSRISDILRMWVDEWLDSAKAKDGAEDPRERTLEKAEGAAVAAYNYSRRGKIRFFPTQGGLAIWLEDKNRKFTKPMTTFHIDNVRPLAVTDEEIAEGELVFFLLSELRFRLAKCRADGCGCYFIMKKWRQRYFNGTKCAVHQRSASLDSAKKATSIARINAPHKLFQLGAKKFARQIRSNPDWHRKPELKASIAAYLDGQVRRSEELTAVYITGARNGITGKWLARKGNWQGIEKALKAIPDVASKPKPAKKAKR
jgi:hypothetical protein